MLTEEQNNIVEAVQSNNDKVIAVNAIAGSGKTRVSRAIVETIRPRKGFYTAFNRAIVQDSNSKFGKLIPCKTLHSLAYKYANPKHRNINDLNYKDIDLDLNVRDKVQLIDDIDRFFRSSYIDVEEFIENEQDISSDKDNIILYADKMLNEELKPTFSFLLKKFHLMLIDKSVNPTFDIFIIDEAQDINGVMLEIFKLIDADKKIILGDKYQNIYSFMNTVNAFEKLDNIDEYKLTKCFRCTTNIANKVENYGNIALEHDYIFNGNEDLDDIEDYNKITYLCKRNSTLVELMSELVDNNETFSLVRDVNTIFEFPLALYCAGTGKEVYSNKYKYLEDLYKEYNEPNLVVFLETLMNDVNLDEQTQYTAKVLFNLNKKGINIFNLRQQVKNMVSNPNVVLSTIHTYKGLESDIVYINTDIIGSVMDIIDTCRQEYFTNNPSEFRQCISIEDKEVLNLMYVGMTRARFKLEGIV